MISKNTKFTIVGLGLIGGSYAKALSDLGYTVYGIDNNSDTIKYALKHHIISAGGESPTYLSKADIIISGLYPQTMLTYFKTNVEYIPLYSIISDVSGVKGSIIDTMQTIIGDQAEFIGSHPMAGKEVNGIENSDPMMFVEANFIITPTDKNTPNTILVIDELAQLLRFKNISVITTAEHDQMIAFVSQLTHAIAVSLMNCKNNQHLVEYTGDSFRDLTRIADINELLWSELFFLNKDALINEIAGFINELNSLKSCLYEDDKEGLMKLFTQARERRKLFNKK